MREVSRQTAREGSTREGGGVLATGKAAPYTSVHLSFFFFLWMKLQRHVAGFPNSVFLSTPLSALSQRNG